MARKPEEFQQQISHTDRLPVHFVWVGGLPSDDLSRVTEGPRQLMACTGSEKLDVTMWTTADNVSQLQALMPIGVTVKPIESLYEKGSSIERACQTIKAHNAPIMMKDLMVLRIMSKMGGFFFDTTMSFHEGCVQKMLELNRGDDDQLFVHTRDGSLQPYGQEMTTIQHIDVWSLYAKPGENKVFQAALLSYLSILNAVAPGIIKPSFFQRCLRTKPTLTLNQLYNFMRIVQGDLDQPETASIMPLREIFQDDAVRDDFIGRLVLYACYDGMLAGCTELGDVSALQEHVSQQLFDTVVVDPNDSCKRYLEELGVTKIHRGSWRKHKSEHASAPKGPEL